MNNRGIFFSAYFYIPWGILPQCYNKPFIGLPLTHINPLLQADKPYKLITRYFRFAFFFLQLFCISLLPLIFPDSTQILLDNALFCRQNTRLKNRLFCSQFGCGRQNLSKPILVLLNEERNKCVLLIPGSVNVKCWVVCMCNVDEMMFSEMMCSDWHSINVFYVIMLCFFFKFCPPKNLATG